MPTDLFDNAEYVDQAPPADSVHSTPPERSHGESLSIYGKGRVRDADSKFNGNRCLVENCIEEKAVEFAHCLARFYRNNSDLLDSLEWFWNMRQGTLNLDTRYNIFRLTATLHRLFDNDSWFLLPQDVHVDTYYNSLWDAQSDRYTFPIIPNGRFQYKLAPNVEKMKNMAIMCQQTADNPTPADFIVHHHPYKEFPAMTTHLHPRFVICNTAQKYLRLRQTQRKEMVKAYPLLAKIRIIYMAWTSPIPGDHSEDSTYDPHGDPDDDGTNQSINSANHTVNTRSGVKRRRMADPKDRGSPEPRGGESSKGRKHAMYARLSGETLQALNTVFGSEPTKSLQTTKESVYDWLMDCSKIRKENGGWNVRKFMRLFGRKECY